MTEPVTCKGQIELEVTPGFTAEVTIRFIPTPAEPDQTPPPTPAQALRAAA